MEFRELLHSINEELDSYDITEGRPIWNLAKPYYTDAEAKAYKDATGEDRSFGGKAIKVSDDEYDELEKIEKSNGGKYLKPDEVKGHLDKIRKSTTKKSKTGSSTVKKGKKGNSKAAHKARNPYHAADGKFTTKDGVGK